MRSIQHHLLMVIASYLSNSDSWPSLRFSHLRVFVILLHLTFVQDFYLNIRSARLIFSSIAFFHRLITPCQMYSSSRTVHDSLSFIGRYRQRHSSQHASTTWPIDCPGISIFRRVNHSNRLRVSHLFHSASLDWRDFDRLSDCFLSLINLIDLSFHLWHFESLDDRCFQSSEWLFSRLNQSLIARWSFPHRLS